ncbi:MAG: phosphatidate cytidylyltransferase [Thermodesulfobacteriota bacterium]
MKTRIISGVLMLLAWLALLYLNNFSLFWLASCLLAILGGYEFFTMRGERGASRLSAIIITGLPVFILVKGGSHDLLLAALAAGLVLHASWTVFSAGPGRPPFDQFNNRLLGLAYIGFTIPHILLLVTLEHGVIWLLILSTITIASDSGAYFCGKAWGSHKLSPHISPGKTVEGFVGGVVSGTAVTTIFGYFFLPQTNLAALAVVAALLCCLGVIGDLSESIIKRASGVKDSSHLIPGHGGILDRVDSLLFCAPSLYYILHLQLL